MKKFSADECIGRVIEDCRVERRLMCGPTSAVYAAQQQQPRRLVALTLFLLPEALSDAVYQQFRIRFLHAAANLLPLSHPCVLPVYNYGEWEGWPYLITPYKTEGSLATLIKQQVSFSPPRILSLLEQVVEGLEYAHRRGQVHGILTPANVLRNNEESFQVAGFGLRQILERRGILPYTQPSDNFSTLSDTPLCVPKYLAPEYRQGQAAQIRSDVYSLGVMLVELYCGQFLANTLTASEILDLLQQQKEWSLPTSLQKIVMQALAEDPEKRFPRVHDLLTAYAEYVKSNETQVQARQFDDQLNSLVWSSSADRPIQDLHDHQRSEAAPNVLSFVKRWSIPSFSSFPLSLPEIKSNVASMRQPGSKSRRQVTALLAGGLVTGIVGVGGFNLIQRLTTVKPGATIKATNEIGQTTQALNSEQTFLDTRVADHRQRLLIHLPNGNFVAYKQGCTHSGVLVNYDPKTHLLVCPAHGAIFDPAQNGRVIQGPATTPLPQVAIQVNGAGIITLH
ncbi:hypothetical protein KDA_56620 [Dictyobacter alpinus]|uniref:non-specific serine/threonine protein kinase n=1 Tax=Dictyobacter alpinus TaxID=2014873 RepID=A0A402BFK8_9CHLR|nr:protein kinase [Dictyobacter alpinus]GCE30178.1 hypothetical protein KDA_56620 [Dictyobacter alpinus]